MELFSENLRIETLEEAVRLFNESRTGFVMLFNSSPVCMSMTTTDLDRRVYVRVNRKFIDTFGFEEADIIGRTSVEIGILNPEESTRVGNLIQEKGRLQNDYVRCQAKSGRLVHTVSSIEFMEIGGTTYLVSFFVDVTKIVEQQAMIEQHARLLEKANKDLESFSYSVSHDLRAPLRSINGFAKILEEDYASLLDDEGKKFLGSIVKNALRMDNLINDLLAFSRLGRAEVDRSSCNMNQIVESVLKDFPMQRDSITVDDLYPANANPDLIRQVFVNLISNAIKYSSFTTNPRIWIESYVEGGNAVYVVSDNGAGFDMNHAGKLFGVFQRLHSSSEFEGTGVGLAIVKRIVERHDGAVWAEGEKGKGARFYFSLPLLSVASRSGSA